MFYNVLLALNGDQNETDYLRPSGNLKTVELGPINLIYESAFLASKWPDVGAHIHYFYTD